MAGIIYDQLGNRIWMGVHQLRGASVGLHEILLMLDAPTLRQGEYFMNMELLPIFDFNWPASERLPYLCLWDRCVFFKIDEGYHGTIPLGILTIPSRVRSATLTGAETVVPRIL